MLAWSGPVAPAIEAAVVAMAAAFWRPHPPPSAQTIEEESDRIPGLPEPSIGTSLPRELADPGGVRSALGRGASSSPSTTSARCSAIRPAAIRQGAFYDGRLELAVAGRPGEDDRLAGPELLCQRLPDPRPQHFGGEPRRADAGELHRGGPGHAPVRAVAGAEAVGRQARRSASGSSRPIPIS